jgi:hypothetical protein
MYRSQPIDMDELIIVVLHSHLSVKSLRQRVFREQIETASSSKLQ